MDSGDGKKAKLKRINFVLDAPEAQEVSLVGSFNDWSVKKHPMKKDGGNAWKKTVMLAPGNYEYKFWVDGRWVEDPQNERRCANSFGTVNSVVKVPA